MAFVGEPRRRVGELVERLDVDDADAPSDAIWLLIDGASANRDELAASGYSTGVLRAAALAVVRRPV